jgi:hypothetical protein
MNVATYPWVTGGGVNVQTPEVPAPFKIRIRATVNEVSLSSEHH